MLQVLQKIGRGIAVAIIALPIWFCSSLFFASGVATFTDYNPRSLLDPLWVPIVGVIIALACTPFLYRFLGKSN